MKIISSISEMQARANSLRSEGKKIGFVPTMGFLHEGHLSLMSRARQENQVLIASIFVNPTQFGPTEDLERYPRDAKGDQAKCETAGVDLLFTPAAAEMYPAQPSVFVTVEGVSDVLEGAVRPGHFRGVATVVAKLFHIVKPHAAYFGQKDFQQCVVLKRMVRELNLEVAVRVLPTVREQDGLAMSSRNSYLTPDERRKSSLLNRGLSSARELYLAGETDAVRLQERVRGVILKESGITIDYIEIVDPETLAPLKKARPQAALLLAARLGRTRLIDNLVL